MAMYGNELYDKIKELDSKVKVCFMSATCKLMMPKMDGFELYERLKKVDPDVRICFLTASEMYHEKMRDRTLCFK
jgi:CheY-like chemotaxis protein